MDAKRWSADYKRMLNAHFDGALQVATLDNGMVCVQLVGCVVTAGVGRTFADAYVDFVEEYECLLGQPNWILRVGLPQVRGARA